MWDALQQRSSRWAEIAHCNAQNWLTKVGGLASESDRNGGIQPEIGDITCQAELARHVQECLMPEKGAEAYIDAVQYVVRVAHRQVSGVRVGDKADIYAGRNRRGRGHRERGS